MSSLFNMVPEVTTHSYYRGKRNFMLAQDTHPGWVILAAESGEFEYVIHNEQGQAGFGDLVVCPPNTLLKRRAITTLSYHFILFSCRFEEEGSQESQIPWGKIQIQNKERLAENLRYMKIASEMIDGYNIKRVSQLLHDIWYMYGLETSPSAMSSSKKINDGTIKQIAAFLNENAFSPIVLKNVAAEHGISGVQLTRKFYSSLGITPHHYLNTIRIQKAQTLLLETNLNLQQIADETGYENGFYLSRVFKNKIGISPSEFRRLNQI